MAVGGAVVTVGRITDETAKVAKRMARAVQVQVEANRTKDAVQLGRAITVEATAVARVTNSFF